MVRSTRRARTRSKPSLGGRSGLAARHGVNHVIDAYHFDVDIPPGGVHQVIASDCAEIAVTGIDHYLKRRVGQFQPRGERDSTTVRRMKESSLK
jgi:hypothetical protein